jgi:hypothetical protein
MISYDIPVRVLCSLSVSSRMVSVVHGVWFAEMRCSLCFEVRH